MSDLQPLTAQGIARLFAVDLRTVSRWVKAGLPAEKVGRALAIDPAAAVAWVHARETESWEARLGAATSTPDIDAQRCRKLAAEADIEEMRRDEKRGELVSKPEVERAWSNHVLQVRARLLSLPAHARVRGVPAEAAVIVEGLIAAALESLSKPEAPDAPEAESEDEAAAEVAS